jgi:uracil phosphoribosyltransferase
LKNLTVINHPLVQHNLTRLRDERTQPQEFRRLLGEIAGLMTYEATRSLGVKKISVRTPMEKTAGAQLEKEIVLVPILRAGLGMLDGILEMIPHARVGFLGLKRDEKTLAAHFYQKSLPKNLSRCEVILIDPMLATGGSAVAAIDFLREQGAKSIRLVSLVAAPEGIARVRKSHKTLPIFTAAVDRQLNGVGYILPGLGDAGDRLFGT